MTDTKIHLRINVKQIVKDWLFAGEKGTYLDLVLFFKAQQDEYGHNGMVVQSVPKHVYDADPSKRGPILGNALVFKPKINEEAIPGAVIKNQSVPAEDDLPF